MTRTKPRRPNRTPKVGHEYLVSDSCGWKPLDPAAQAAYNPYHAGRLPHAVELVDVDTGSVVHLTSGSVVRIVRFKKHG